jgi:hypothetical protein
MPSEAPKGRPSIGSGQIVALSVVVVGLIVVTALALGHFNSERDTATGILGIVVPVFATIGAAVFGVTVAYSAGRTTGEAAGADAKRSAVQKGRSELASQVLERLRPAGESVERILEPLTTLLPSPEGERAHVLPAGAALGRPLRIEGEDLEGASRCLAGARSLLEGELSAPAQG